MANDLDARVQALEARVAALEQQIGGGSISDPLAELPADVADLLRDGERLDAIKRYMKIEGVTLKDATYAIDAVDVIGRKSTE